MAVRTLTTPEAIELLADDGDAVHLDVRSVPEYQAGHPPGAYNIPVAHRGGFGLVANPAFVDEVSRAFAKDTPIVVSCAAGKRSLQAAQMLVEAGFSQVYDHCGGWNGNGAAGDPGWTGCGGGLSTEREQGRCYEDLK